MRQRICDKSISLVNKTEHGKKQETENLVLIVHKVLNDLRKKMISTKDHAWSSS